MAVTRYPGFDVTAEKEAWDAHTRKIVMARVERRPEAVPEYGPEGGPEREAGRRFSFLTPEEAESLAVIARHLLHEDRDELIGFVVEHFDRTRSGGPGESDRKADCPPAAQLVRQGLAAIDAAAKHRHWRRFVHCRTEQQFEILAGLQLGRLEPIPEWIGIPQEELFKMLLATAVDAYASHPKVWSEMGYAGPAYPRGYYRIERGLRDPWEPAAAGAPARPGR